MPNTALEAYQDVARTTATGRDLEALALTNTALRLQAVRNDWDAPEREARLAEALRLNQRLWTYFQVELMREDNPLPEAVRRNLLELSLFVDRRTFQVMAQPVAEKLDILIDINHNIAAGLRGQTAP